MGQTSSQLLSTQAPEPVKISDVEASRESTPSASEVCIFPPSKLFHMLIMSAPSLAESNAKTKTQSESGVNEEASSIKPCQRR